MTDPMRLLTAANPVRDCPGLEFERLLERLEQEPGEAKTARRLGSGRRAVTALVPIAITALVVGFVIASFGHNSERARLATPMAFSPGQARGAVVPGSMRLFNSQAESGGRLWGAAVFRTTARQVCVEAGRLPRGTAERLGYFGVGGAAAAEGSFHPYPPDKAVDARCIAQPAHSGAVLMVVARYADSGLALTEKAACPRDHGSGCERAATTNLAYGALGRAPSAEYERRGATSSFVPGRPGFDPGGYVQAESGPIPSGHRALVQLTGNTSCILRGPGTDGLLGGACPGGVFTSSTADRLSAANLPTRISITTHVAEPWVTATATFRTPISSVRLDRYAITLTPPATACGRGIGQSLTITRPPTFRAGQTIRLSNRVANCHGSYRVAVIADPIAGKPITLKRFGFWAGKVAP